MVAAGKKIKAFKTYSARASELKKKWFLVDAASQSLGRLSVPIAMRLMGKDKPIYTPHVDTGDFVVVVNAEKIKVHPKKYEGKVYRKWSGYPGGLKVRTLAEVQKKHPDEDRHRVGAAHAAQDVVGQSHALQTESVRRRGPSARGAETRSLGAAGISL